MSADLSDRALRRLVAQFAKLRPSDTEAVLSELSSENRLTVEAMLKGYRGAASPPAASTPKVEPREQVLDLRGLSPWLSEKLRLSSQTGPADLPFADKGSVTATALAALRTSAAEMLKLGLATAPTPSVEPKPGSPLQRITGVFLPGWFSV